MDKLFEELKERFGDNGISSAMLLLTFLDRSTWKFPEWVHESSFDELATFLENSDFLKETFHKEN